MAERELKGIELDDFPELAALIDEVRRSNEPCMLRRNGEDIAMLAPVRPKRGQRESVPRGKPFTKDDPLWNIVGIGRSEGPTDVAQNKHKYLADAYADHHVPQDG